MNKVQVVEAVLKGIGEAMSRIDRDAQSQGTDPQVFAEGLLDGLTNSLAIVATNTIFKSQAQENATMALMRVERERVEGNGGSQS
jgi:hypothetical protein